MRTGTSTSKLCSTTKYVHTYLYSGTKIVHHWLGISYHHIICRIYGDSLHPLALSATLLQYAWNLSLFSNFQLVFTTLLYWNYIIYFSKSNKNKTNIQNINFICLYLIFRSSVNFSCHLLHLIWSLFKTCMICI